MGLKRKTTPSSLGTPQAPKLAPKPSKEDPGIIELIERRRRQIAVHSELYYRMNESIISDHTFDQWCKELVELQLRHPHVARAAALYDKFKDFDGSTGFHLTGDPWVLSKAMNLLDYHRKRYGA